jgi:hypothetical protein
MKQNNSISSNELEDQFSDFTLIEPSASFVDEGQAALARAHATDSKLTWRGYFTYAFSISAVLLITVGFTYSLIQEEPGLPDNIRSVTNSVLGSKQIEEHRILNSTNARIEIQDITADSLFVANCQECHDSRILNAFVPENFDGNPAELDVLMTRAIVDLIDQS